jgi:uncharacterized membrane protein
MAVRTSISNSTQALYHAGVAIFAFAILAIGVETIVCAGTSTDTLGYGYRVIGIIPWLPPIPWLAVIYGAMLAAGGAGLLFKRTARAAALAVGLLLIVPTLILDVSKYIAHASDMSLRTQVFEPVAIVALAWMLLPGEASNHVLVQISRYAAALALVVFGVDHFLALAPIGTLLPGWIPWHVFWIAFFGAGFIAAGLAIAIGRLQRWAALGIALMFAIWVLTLHGPRVLGLYGIPGAPQSPAEWESLFIAVALCGGFLALAFRDVQPDPT